MCQTQLRPIAHRFGLTLLTDLQRSTDPCREAIVPSGLDEHAPCMPVAGLGDVSLAAVLAGAQLDAGVELRQGSISAQIRDAVDFHFHARFDHAGLYRRACRESAPEKSSVGGIHRRKVVTRLDKYGTLDDIGY
jgi:hypothetical protein